MNPSVRPRLFVLGLDGATWTVLDPLLANGHMPNLARAVREGARFILRSTLPPGSMAAWTSFLTGMNPGRHGIYDFVDKKPGSYDLDYVTARSVGAPTFIDIASQLGLRVVSLNLPITYPVWPVNGAMVGGILSPGGGNSWTYPPSLYRDIVAAVGEYTISVDISGLTDGGVQHFVSRIIATERTRFAAARYLLERFSPDLFLMNNYCLDTLQHQLWHFLDPKHPRHDPGRASMTHEFFVMIDQHIGWFLERLGPKDTLLIMSDHGFGPFHRRFDLTGWLAREGYLALRGSARASRALVGVAKGLDVLSLRHRLYGGRRLMRLRDRINSRALFDWSHTRAFLSSDSPYGLLYLNLQGREESGHVDPCVAEELLDELKERLLTIVDPITGQCPVAAVHRRDELFIGPYENRAPDLVIVPAAGYAFFTRTPLRPDSLFESADSGSTGTHLPDGIAVLCGAGAAYVSSFKECHIVALAPMILQLIGVGVPSGTLGDFSANQTGTLADGTLDWIRWSHACCPPPRALMQTPPGDMAHIGEQLKKLGYQ